MRGAGPPARPRTGARLWAVTTTPLAEASALLVALGNLPERERAIVVARYWHGESVAALADRLGLSAPYVRALEQMRQELEPHVEPGA